jgi:hypothetical protein
MAEQIADEEHIIRAGIPARAGVPSRVMVRPYRSLRIGDDDIVGIGKCREASEVLLVCGRTPMSMKIEHECLGSRIKIAPGNMEQVGASNAS